MKDRRITVRQVTNEFDIRCGSAKDLFTNRLAMRRVSARLLSQLLAPEKKWLKIEISKQQLQRYAYKGNLVLDKSEKM